MLSRIHPFCQYLLKQFFLLEHKVEVGSWLLLKINMFSTCVLIHSCIQQLHCIETSPNVLYHFPVMVTWFVQLFFSKQYLLKDRPTNTPLTLRTRMKVAYVKTEYSVPYIYSCLSKVNLWDFLSNISVWKIQTELILSTIYTIRCKSYNDRYERHDDWKAHP